MKKIGMIFPGYGSQCIGMCKELYDESRIIQEYFEQAAICLDSNLVKNCFASSDAELSRIANAYPLIFLVGAAVSAHLKEEGIEPAIVAGYNTGELAAAYAAKGLNFPDALYLINKYAVTYQDLLQELSDIVLLRIVGISSEELQEQCNLVAEEVSSVSIALYNSPTEHIVSGFADAVEVLRGKLKKTPGIKVKAKEIGPEVGLHSSLMDSVVSRMIMYGEKVDFNDMSIQFVSSAKGEIVQDGIELRDQLLNNMNHAVRWDATLDHFVDCDIILEVGPGTTLREQVEKRYPAITVLSINRPEDVSALKSLLVDSSEMVAEDTEK